MDNEVYECTKCSQAVQGWHAANEWFLGLCADGGYQHDWQLANLEEEKSFCAYCGAEYEGEHVCLNGIAVKADIPLADLLIYLYHACEHYARQRRRFNEDDAKNLFRLAEMFSDAHAIVKAAIAMFDSPQAGIGQLKAAVRSYEDK